MYTLDLIELNPNSCKGKLWKKWKNSWWMKFENYVQKYCLSLYRGRGNWTKQQNKSASNDDGIQKW